jgi:hypothetical protein
MKRRFAIRAVRFGPKPTLSSWYQKREFHGTDEKRGSFEGAIRIPLRALLCLFNDLAFLCIPRKSLEIPNVVVFDPYVPHSHTVKVFDAHALADLPRRRKATNGSPEL